MTAAQKIGETAEAVVLNPLADGSKSTGTVLRFPEKVSASCVYSLCVACTCRVEVVSEAFQGKAMVARHRMVYGLLQNELKTGVHALALKTKTPSEAER